MSPLAEKLRADIRNYTTWHNGIKLAGVLAGDSEDAAAASTYSDRIAETFFQDGLEYELVQCANNVLHRSTVAQVIQQLNARRDVHGILVFYPIFATDSHHHHHHHHQQQHKTYLNRLNGTYYKTDDDYLRDCVHPAKDVEGLHGGTNARHLFRARARRRPLADDVYVPCTALAVQKILEAYHFLGTVSGIDYCPTADASARPPCWKDTTVTIINRSEIFGRPLAALLALQGATVYSVDQDSLLEFHPTGRTKRRHDWTLEACLQQSSIVVSGVPDPHFCVPSAVIPDGTTLVNVSEYPNVREADFGDRPGVTVVPQIGKVTVAALEHNLVRLHQRSLGILR